MTHPTRLIVFHGTELERQRWVRERKLNPKYVLPARNALQWLLGWTGPVDTWIASGNDGLGKEDALRLAQQIRLLNDLYSKEPA